MGMASDGFHVDVPPTNGAEWPCLLAENLAVAVQLLDFVTLEIGVRLRHEPAGHRVTHAGIDHLEAEGWIEQGP